MNEQEKNISIKERILEEIRSGQVAMRPKIYFSLKIAALVVIALAVLVITIFILNFILFSIRLNHEDELLGFGPEGILTFLRFFPWLLLLADVGLVFLLETLVRQFRLGYKIPALYLLLALLGFTGVAAAVLDRGTPLNDRLYEHRFDARFPGAEVYDFARRPPPPGSGVCRCTILSIDGDTITVQDTREATSTLVVKLPLDDPRATSTFLEVGDTILIAGEEKDGVIQAFGVRKIPDEGLQIKIRTEAN
jgi:hypothetical protein